MTNALFVLCTLLGALHIVTLQEVFDSSNYRILIDPKGGNFSHHAERCKGNLNLQVFPCFCSGLFVKKIEKFSKLDI